MTHICTLIAARASQALTHETLTQASQAIGGDVQTQELASLSAYDLAFTPSGDEHLANARQRVGEALRHLPVDVAIQPASHRRKALFLADMDSTMIEQECIDELAAEINIKDHIAGITERAMRGEIAFEPALRERVALLKGIPESAIDRVFDARIRLTRGAETLIATMRAHGTYCVLVSGGFTHFTKKVAKVLGFDAHHANSLIVGDGVLTGEVAEPILGKEAKQQTLEAYAAQRGVDLQDTMAIGDGANDLAMIGASGLGVAFRAKPAVRAQADVALNYADLTGALYLQGYRDADFVSA
ncbi:MAG: phosphoserine phosphatase SerB [Pseudomonadota bacterium]